MSHLFRFHKFRFRRSGKAVTIDGQALSIAAVTAAARYHARVELDDSSSVKERVQKSRNAIASKIDSGKSVYGLSTGFGGSGGCIYHVLCPYQSLTKSKSRVADTRTDKPLLLGHALLQHQHVGILPSSNQVLDVLPLQDPMSSSMPEAWVRYAQFLMTSYIS